MSRKGTDSPLTADQKRKYLQQRFGHCPYCDSDNIEGGQVDVEGNRAFQAVRCLACDRHWEDEYVLSGIVEGGCDE